MKIHKEFVVQVQSVGVDVGGGGFSVMLCDLSPILIPLGQEGDEAAVLAMRELGARLYRNVKLTILIVDEP